MEELIVKVGEEEFSFSATSLEKIPDSYLKRLFLQENKCKTVAFSRCRESFRAIHEFCFSGKLHTPKNVCVGKFKEELDFWGIDDSTVEECCLRKIYDYDLQQKSLLKFKSDFSRREMKCEEQDNNNISTKSLRQQIWEILDYKNDSLYAKVYLILSTLVVLASCIMIAVSTLPEIRSTLIMETENKNRTNLQLQSQNSPSSNVHYALSLTANYIRYGIFFFEINIAESNFEFLLYFQMFRILRLLRSLNRLIAFRVLRYSVRNGRKDLALMLSYMFIGMLIFSNFIYFFESDENIPTMFDAWWWSLVTMTTVGYGDMYPKSITGKVIGGMCAIYGVLMFAMTVPIFVNTFHSLYKYAVFANMQSKKIKRKEEESEIPAEKKA
ncbi:potassium voltage-gated channel subfamily B member 2-like [Saccostrea echinata]|uniref:potassium voltage-gated channel subfamily B member 2-like n=1 Tax=Saccostrea echinata TaxID=191078 RepID=UPI002A7F16ED|nr:potassium voltage-gated channel subfamily B member 2-like [Saccostrea echinata]